MDKFDVVVVGTVCTDIIFHGLQSFPELGEEIWAKGMEVTTGGAMNTPAALARLGLQVGLATPVGNDFWSQLNLSMVHKEGISSRFILFLDQPSPQLSVALNYQGDRAFVSYSEPLLLEQYQQHILKVIHQTNVRHFHFYTSPDSGHTDLIRAAKAAGKTISLDSGWNPDWLRSEDIWEQISLADLFLPNLPEAQLITGRQDPQEALETLAAHAPTVVIKLGEQGAICRSDGRVFTAEAFPTTPIDATGAGDCFVAGFLYGWLKELPLHNCLQIANYCGASCVAQVGGFAGAPNEHQLRKDLLLKDL
ncbi:MAG: carbohydrate kinase family protein [Tumebacillaceae bacterium]